MSSENAKRDLRHFLNLASAQLAHKMKSEAGEADAKKMNRMRALQEMIKEQVPTDAEETNSRRPTSTVG